MSVIDIGSNERFQLGKDSIIIRHYGDGIKGGRVLDLTGYTEEFIRCGHVIIMETSTEKYKPMPISNGAYGSLPAGHVYKGICVETTSAKEPFIGIMTDGEVNDKALPYAIDSIKSAFLAAVPNIRFEHD